jgi:hypothetical protein
MQDPADGFSPGALPENMPGGAAADGCQCLVIGGRKNLAGQRADLLGRRKGERVRRQWNIRLNPQISGSRHRHHVVGPHDIVADGIDSARLFRRRPAKPQRFPLGVSSSTSPSAIPSPSVAFASALKSARLEYQFRVKHAGRQVKATIP